MILTGLLCGAYAVLAANVYQYNKDSRLKIKGLEDQIAQKLEDNAKLYKEIYGGDSSVEIKSWKDCGLDCQLARLRSLEAGDVFVNCKAEQTVTDSDAKTAKVSFVVDPRYKMTSFREGAVAYLFDSGVAYARRFADSEESAPVAESDGEQTDADSTAVAASAPYVFLGAFRIVGTQSSQVSLESIGDFTQAELDLLDATRKGGRSFVACVDRLPVDSPADIADFVAEKPGVVAGYRPEVAADLAKKTADVAIIAENVAADEATTLSNFDSIFANNADLRLPIAYQARLERQWTARAERGVMIERNTLALADLDSVIADQLALMGDKPSEGLEDKFQARVAATSNFEGFDSAYAAAKTRRRVLPYFEKIDATREDLSKMKSDVALVERLLAEAEQNNKDCVKAIDRLVAENSKLAADLARVTFAISEQLESRVSTASIDAAAILGNR